MIDWRKVNKKNIMWSEILYAITIKFSTNKNIKRYNSKFVD